MAKKLTAIITGDIIASRRDKSQAWLKVLRKILSSGGTTPKNWEIFRGDSFQLEVNPAEALDKALMIKTELRQLKNINVRMGIGIGEKSYNAAKITEANGTAFINSGECFDSLKKQTLAIKTPWADFDQMMNTMLSLALLTIDSWKPATAAIVKSAMENPVLNQQQLATKLKKTQSNISEGLKRGGYEEIQNMLAVYKNQIPEK